MSFPRGNTTYTPPTNSNAVDKPLVSAHVGIIFPFHHSLFTDFDVQDAQKRVDHCQMCVTELADSPIPNDATTFVKKHRLLYLNVQLAKLELAKLELDKLKLAKLIKDIDFDIESAKLELDKLKLAKLELSKLESAKLIKDIDSKIESAKLELAEKDLELAEKDLELDKLDLAKSKSKSLSNQNVQKLERTDEKSTINTIWYTCR
jgi:hypothetical protein